MSSCTHSGTRGRTWGPFATAPIPLRSGVQRPSKFLSGSGTKGGPVTAIRVAVPSPPPRGAGVVDVVDTAAREGIGASCRALSASAPRYRLPLIVLEATGMRVGELETLSWGDVDEQGGRWRVARQNEKGRRGRWVNVSPDVFAAVSDQVPREDRGSDALVFPHATQAKLRTDMARACKAAGIPVHSPYDLRHRRISLWHMQGVPLAQVGAWVGQRNLSTTADVYTHVLADGEIDRADLLARVPT